MQHDDSIQIDRRGAIGTQGSAPLGHALGAVRMAAAAFSQADAAVTRGLPKLVPQGRATYRVRERWWQAASMEVARR